MRARAVPLLEHALREDVSPDVRAEAALAIADLGAQEALPALLVTVEDDDARVRQMALIALGEIGDSRATQRLARALRDQRPEVRYQAVIAYARVLREDAQAVVSALIDALDDRDEAIRYIAMRVAEEYELGGRPFFDDRLVARALELVDAPGDTLAVVAALYLARVGHARGRQAVVDVVAERKVTTELEDEEACVELAGELQLTEAIPHLERRVWSRRRVLRTIFSWGAGDRASCAWHARIALARMQHARARAEILADLASRRREVRSAGVVAAGKATITEARATLERLQGSVDSALVREALDRLNSASA